MPIQTPSSSELISKAYEVFRTNRMLLIFPLLSCLSWILLFTSFALPAFIFEPHLGSQVSELFSAMHQVKRNSLAQNALISKFFIEHPELLPAIFFFYFFTFLSFSFFNGCIVACVVISLNGEQPTIQKALVLVTGRLPQLLGWACISATVGTLMQLLEMAFSRSDATKRMIMRITSFLFGTAWTLASLLVIPIIIIEGCGPIEALKRSSLLFKTTWLQEVKGSLKMGFVSVVIIVLLSVFLGISMAMPLPLPVHVATFGIYLFSIVLLSASMGVVKVIYRTILFLKVTEPSA